MYQTYITKKSKNKPVLLFILFFLFLPALLFGEDKSPTAGTSTMVRSDDGKHKVIKEACSVCHKEEEFDFLIMIYSTKSKGVKGGAPGSPASQANQPKMEFTTAISGKDNFHKQMNCFFCHLKDESNNPIKDKFLSLDGKVSSLCTICHTAVADLHFLSNVEFDRKEMAVLLQGYGLKLNEDGTVNCITCHTIHSDKAFGRSIKNEFKQFIKEVTYYNPHGSEISCIACHKTKPEPKQTVTFVDDYYENMCRRCHVADIADHHVTGVSSSEKTYLMDFLTLPLYNGKIYCSTCHDEVCYKKINPRNKDFLIGGPFKSKDDFCHKCHKRELSKEDNPHRQIDEKGNIIKTRCAICHKTLPSEGDKEIELAASVFELCKACHIVFDHPDLNHLVELKGEKLDNLKTYEADFKIKLPLQGENQITCFTCHNPHDKGVLKGIGSLGAGEHMMLRGVSFEEACTPCHGKIY